MLMPMSRMELNLDHCEEQLKTSLHCDDKEKLRRKLALLQREYLKTAQRLQRAERSEAVRRHVKSRIEQENNKEQRQSEVLSSPCVNPPSVTLNSTDGFAASLPQCQENTGDPSGSDIRRSQVIRFLLPSESDAASPQTPNPNHETTRGHRSSPALRLRSKRSRLRLERRSAAGAERNSDVSEDGPEPSEKVATPEERAKTEEAEVVNESEELFSGESKSPSLLLTHWDSSGQTEKPENQETPRVPEQTEKETKEEDKSISLLHKSQASNLHFDKREKDGQQNGKSKEKKGEEQGKVRKKRDGKQCEDSSNTGSKQDTAEKKEREERLSNALDIKTEKCEVAVEEQDVKNVSLLDSCTLVEGLLFPAEYYVRTTRRMSSSQSQPNMEAVIHTQLSMRRPRRSRGRGRGQNKPSEDSEKCSQADFSSPTALSSPMGPCVESTAGTAAELLSQSSCEISDQTVTNDALLTPNVTAARPARGRRRGRGRGRGRPRTPRCSLSLEINERDQQIPDTIDLTSTPASASPTLHASKVAAPEPDPPEPAAIHSTATQPCSSRGNGSLCSSASEDHGKVYPIFVKSSSSRSTRPTQMGRGTTSWQSLLLPPSSPAQTLLPLPTGSPVNHLLNSDRPQDFHLPDDQFASLKLHKLRRVSSDSGVEHLVPSSSSTCRSIQRPDAPDSPVSPLPVPHSLTPVITDSSHQTEVTQVASQKSKDLENLWIQHSHVQESPAEPALMVQDCAAGFDQHKEKETLINNTHNQTDSNTNRSDLADSPAGKVSKPQTNQPLVVSLEEQKNGPGVAQNVEDQKYKYHQTNKDTETEDKDVIKTLSFDSPGKKTPEHTSKNSTKCNQSPVQTLNVCSPVQRSKKPPEHIASPPRAHRVDTQLLLSPLLASAPFTAPLLPPSFVDSSPTLPYVGPTPCPDPSSLPLTSSPCAPVLNLPPPYSPSTQNLSPPPLSPCMSPTFFPPSQPQKSPVAQVLAPSEPSQVPPVPRIQDQVGMRKGATALRRTHTLKAPAGGCLVDACCLTMPSGGLCVAAAGKWAVCLWSQTAACDWSLTHTWAFNEPVINVFPVADAAGLLYVTLGQLEIREVRMLSCSSLSQVLLCEGLVQAVVGMSRSRVVTSSHSAPGSTLQVFTLSDCGSTSSSRPLVSPGVCVGALAAVDGLSDALIGTDEGGRLFVWNLKTGQLLRRISLIDGLSHTACLRGYSYCGVLFVLLQHHLLSSLEEEERESKEKDGVFSEDEKERKSALFSLVAVNPQSGKSVLATQLYPPEAWSGRLCEADVCSSRVVGLSQSGCACVWELERRGASTMIRATESEGWQLARWGGRDTLVTGHFNGDVSLHHYSTSQTTLLN
ncbi:uncharacterized protein palb2 [Halichoeres trimaculatus]|uniref:uncharacterized protein palb2 n=1 Tax=Halichoeres trimaculatus TaxID=147232 RepID=UPI003D9F5CA5